MGEFIPWRYDGEVFESGLTPSKELESFSIPLKLTLFILRQRVCSSGHVDLDRVVDHEVDGAVRVHF